MDRRMFAQLFTFGGASLPLLQAMADEKRSPAEQSPDEPQSDETANPRQPGQPLSGEPVNVADFRALAEAKLPKATFDYISTGSADGITLRENVAAFRRIKVLPPLLKGVSLPDLSTTVLKQRISLPIMLAPVAAQRMYHPQGVLAAARAAESAGTVFGVSSSAGNSVEEIARESDGPKWFQLYVPKDRQVARSLVQRVERAGYDAIIVTVDLGEWKDSFGHTSFGSSQMTVAQTIVNYLNANGLAAKGVARCNVSGTDQRNAIAYASSVDLDEAYKAGETAVELAASGQSGFMSTILRNAGPIYGVTFDKVPLAEVANSERTFPEHWISANGVDVTDDFVNYCRPLVGEGMVNLPMIDGRQRLSRIQPIYAKQKLDCYVPQANRSEAPVKH